MLGEYKNNRTKIKIRHNKCSHDYEVVPTSFLRGIRCPRCAGNEVKTSELFRKEVFEIVGTEYTVLGEYINADTKIKMRHNECTYEYEVRPDQFLRGVRCPRCALIKKNKTTEVYKQEVFDLVGTDYTVIGECNGTHNKTKMKHNKCSHVYEVSPNNFLRGSRCPNCNKSKGEHKVEKYLTKIQTCYTKQYKFDDCRNINRLQFDFAIFTNGEVVCLIEYDGEYHYKPFSHAGGEKGLAYRKKCDSIKTKYCADHNIPLIRIPYWEFDNIDEILTKELRKLGVIETENIAS